MSVEKRGIKLVVIGDGTVGKTCMLIRFKNNEFPTKYVPTVFDNHAVIVRRGDEERILHMFDTSGQEEYDQLRQLILQGTDILLVCFSTDNRNSFNNIETRWMPEIKSLCPEIPILLVGTKIDLRSEEITKKFISAQEGEELGKRIGVEDYRECSALTGENIVEVFEKACEVVLAPPIPNSDGGICKRITRLCILM